MTINQPTNLQGVVLFINPCIIWGVTCLGRFFITYSILEGVSMFPCSGVDRGQDTKVIGEDMAGYRCSWENKVVVQVKGGV